MDSFTYIDDELPSSGKSRFSISPPSTLTFELIDGKRKGRRPESTGATRPPIVEEEDEDDPSLTSCGIGAWRPGWLQMFNHPIVFLINVCLIGIVQSMGGSLIYATTNMLEKRYAYDSKISGIISIADNISSMLLGPIVGLYGIRYNRARLIGVGELIIALSCFISATPYFIYGPATHFLSETSLSSTSSSLLSSISNSSSSLGSSFQMCSLNGTSNGENCTAGGSGSTVWPAVIIFFIGNALRGVGFSIYYVIAMPFVDDNVPKRNSPIFIAIMQCTILLGPASGYVVFAFFLRLYEDPWNDPGLSPTDPRFIGAWWLGFLMVGVLILVVASPMFIFPGQFKNAPIKTRNLKKQIKESGGTKSAFARFFANPLILLFFFGNATRYSGIIGFYMFLVKYIETTFRQSSSSAGLLLSFASLLPMAVGIIGGGVIISVFKPRARYFFIFLFLAEFVTFFTIGSGLFLGCDPIKLEGHREIDGTFSLGESCNSGCDCTTRVFTPLCDQTSKTTYFSPCHAGCSSANIQNTTFSDCSCFSSGSTASKGYCPEDVSKCLPSLYTWMAILAVGNAISTTSVTGNFLINYRAVEPMDKSFASGLVQTLVSIFSFIPVPLLYGHIADSSCLVWETKCGKRGNCWVYDNDKFRSVYFTTTIIFLGLGSFFDFLMIFYSDRMKNLYDDEPAIEATKNGEKGEAHELNGLNAQGESDAEDN